MNLKLLLLLGFYGNFFACQPDDSNEPSTYSHEVRVGSSANHIISGETYKFLQVQFQYMPDQKPTQRALDEVKVFIESIIEKPKGIEYFIDEVPSGGKESYTTDDIREYERKHRTMFSSGDTLAVYFLFADADDAGNDQNSVTLGKAYWNTSMVLYEKTISDRTGGIGKPRQDVMESTVLQHEFGHILGLVNLNDDMVSYHEDNNHEGHCKNTECLMYWTTGNGSFVQDLVGRQVAPSLDEACLMDIEARK
ncbi:MAG: peptidase [Bacteroidetes bacterium]|nr:peptidase [Bacteroidota bacterium]